MMRRLSRMGPGKRFGSRWQAIYANKNYLA